jgi:hypothetical protein
MAHAYRNGKMIEDEGKPDAGFHRLPEMTADQRQKNLLSLGIETAKKKGMHVQAAAWQSQLDAMGTGIFVIGAPKNKKFNI